MDFFQQPTFYPYGPRITGLRFCTCIVDLCRAWHDMPLSLAGLFVVPALVGFAQRTKRE